MVRVQERAKVKADNDLDLEMKIDVPTVSGDFPTQTDYTQRR